jgi:hypothetical protein
MPMKAIAFAALFALSAPPAWAYGAIALGVCSTPGSGYSFSYGPPSQAVADALALRECSAHTSVYRIVILFVQKCFAVALDLAQCGAAGEVASPYLSIARRVAYQDCLQTGGSARCTVVAANCD